jgi:hypothetical protein
MSTSKDQSTRFEDFRWRLRGEPPGLSPLARALLRALANNREWLGESPSWLAVALWAHEPPLVEGKPTRQEVAEALEELRERRAA